MYKYEFCTLRGHGSAVSPDWLSGCNVDYMTTWTSTSNTAMTTITERVQGSDPV